ncbi:hypothetical protein BGZ95_007231 [Linnemannia exigua]|uniref:FAM192A/Fyv6 N-terminal domain-containing protein n=1 Tax=Linnemannia exigua TaxID=604196 RepID=A0AAD4DL72_9FUNG|nr:hypothetical protein BGZ95_007231 [Linnemannia exigua]
MATTLIGEGLSQGGFGPFLSYLIGWAYFIAWSASFYPQAILNWRRKTVQGLSMDFVHLNVVGFLCYSIFNLAFFFSSEIQEEYKRRNDGQENLVRANDVFFAAHALILSTFTLVQTWVYKRDEGQRVSGFAWAFLLSSGVSVVILVGRALQGKGYEWIDILYFLSYIKLIISFIKYCPQVYINWAAKSTVGWSIHNILLDFTGGVLSIGQLVLDAYISDDWSGISGDPVKFGLGFLSIAFDLVFITQHYVLYRNRTDRYAQQLSMVESSESSDERQGLLSSATGRYVNSEAGINVVQIRQRRHVSITARMGRLSDARDYIADRGSELEEARKARKEEWDKAYSNNENPPPIQEEVPYDPRTLYERLQEQKQKKSDAFAEATKFGNLIHKIDNDEFDFLSSLEDDEAKKKREQAEQEAEALKNFRMNVISKAATAPAPLLEIDGRESSATKPTYFAPLSSGPAKKKKSLFAGLVAKPDSKAVSSATSTNADTTGKRKLDATADEDENEDGKEEEDGKVQTKKVKADTLTGGGEPAKPKGLVGLVAYDSSSDEDDE